MARYLKIRLRLSLTGDPNTWLLRPGSYWQCGGRGGGFRPTQHTRVSIWFRRALAVTSYTFKDSSATTDRKKRWRLWLKLPWLVHRSVFRTGRLSLEKVLQIFLNDFRLKGVICCSCDAVVLGRPFHRRQRELPEQHFTLLSCIPNRFVLGEAVHVPHYPPIPTVWIYIRKICLLKDKTKTPPQHTEQMWI